MQQARFMPRSVAGLASIVGYLVVIAAFVVLINQDFGWLWPSVALAAGVSLTWIASAAVQRKFEREASAAGFNTAEVRAIEDEAERLNDEEYP
ncbi:hypothetical protein [Brevundimonas sp.]|uniref:hypothetical protein n=1 Tax=Brevundimonas sp. TaxID=1871086 RepID=UPI002629FBFA|nr:hypothetical protein [Brevundimonas sp.]